MPHYDRHANPSAEQNSIHPATSGADDEALEGAAEALREVEVEAARPEPDVPPLSSLSPSQLESMDIDALRVVAMKLDVPDRAAITDKDELIAAIRPLL